MSRASEAATPSRTRARTIRVGTSEVYDDPAALAQTFGVIPAGMGSHPVWYPDVVAAAQAERAILEFELPETGRYMFHPHQHHPAMRGAMGWMAAI